jgi:hypothetical protein
LVFKRTSTESLERLKQERGAIVGLNSNKDIDQKGLTGSTITHDDLFNVDKEIERLEREAGKKDEGYPDGGDDVGTGGEFNNGGYKDVQNG